MSKKLINNQDDIKIEAEYKDKNKKAKLNAKSHGKHGTQGLVFIIVAIVVALGTVNIAFAATNYLSNKKETTNEDFASEVTTISTTSNESKYTPQESTEITTTETEPTNLNSKSFLKNIEEITNYFEGLITTEVSDKYSPEDGELLQKVSEREKEYGENISFNQLNENIKDRESVAKHTHNSRLYFLLGKDYQRLANNIYSNNRDLSQVDCLQKSNNYYIKALEYFALSFLVCDDENMRISKSTIFKYLSQNYMSLGDIDKQSSYQHYCYSLVTHCLYKKYYNHENEYITSEIDNDNWNYTQGLIYFDIYEKYPNDSEEDRKYLYDKCVESYLNVNEPSQDYDQASHDLTYFTNMYSKLYRY